MKKSIKRLILYKGLLLFSILFALSANARYNFGIGMNISSLQKDKTAWEPSYLISVGRIWHLWDRVCLSGDIRYLHIKSMLKDKTIGPYPGGTMGYVSFNNISVSIRCLEFPLGIIYSIPFNKMKLNLLFNTGTSFVIADNSKFHYLYEIKIDPDSELLDSYGNYKYYDYSVNEDGESLLSLNSGFITSAGFGLEYGPAVIVLLYQIHQDKLNLVNHALINEKLNSVIILLKYNF
ncbi:hypothetical protein JW835_09495 [bacterium]|nr:hypothetical protein [bacterium]